MVTIPCQSILYQVIASCGITEVKSMCSQRVVSLTPFTPLMYCHLLYLAYVLRCGDQFTHEGHGRTLDHQAVRHEVTHITPRLSV
jgi:hypothetical protein